jgi:hypothetical protein
VQQGWSSSSTSWVGRGELRAKGFYGSLRDATKPHLRIFNSLLRSCCTVSAAGEGGRDAHTMATLYRAKRRGGNGKFGEQGPNAQTHSPRQGRLLVLWSRVVSKPNLDLIHVTTFSWLDTMHFFRHVDAMQRKANQWKTHRRFVVVLFQ